MILLWGASLLPAALTACLVVFRSAIVGQARLRSAKPPSFHVLPRRQLVVRMHLGRVWA